MYISVVALDAQEEAFATLPRNTQGVIGQNVTLNCALANPGNILYWKNQLDANIYEKGTGILDGFEGQYLVEESGNSYNLIILNTEPNDAGRYTCNCATQSSSAVAEVILLGKCPNFLTENTNSIGNVLVACQRFHTLRDVKKFIYPFQLAIYDTDGASLIYYWHRYQRYFSQMVVKWVETEMIIVGGEAEGELAKII